MLCAKFRGFTGKSLLGVQLPGQRCDAVRDIGAPVPMLGSAAVEARVSRKSITILPLGLSFPCLLFGACQIIESALSAAAVCTISKVLPVKNGLR
jgi:hypothetical protein